MQCSPYQLAQHLEKHFLPVYVLYGNEPFLIEESAILIKQKLRQLGEFEQITVSLAQQCTWSLLEGLTQPSLFTPTRLVELRFTKLTAEQAAQLTELLIHADPHTYFLIQTERTQQQAKWFQAAQQRGIVIPHWPLSPPQFAAWIKQRLAQRAIILPSEIIQLLIYHTEGNCLAAAQEIERLSTYHFLPASEGKALPLSQQSQFTIFDLCEAAMKKQPTRVLKIVSCLKETDAAPFQLVIWALCQSLRALLKCLSSNQEDMQRRWLQQAGIRVTVQDLYLRFLRQPNPRLWATLLSELALADQQFKAGEVTAAWQKVLEVSLLLADTPLCPVRC